MITLFTTLALAAGSDVDRPLPPLDAPEKLRAATHTVNIDVPVPEFWAWWRRQTLADLAVQTDRIPAVVSTELLVGDAWSGVGTRRRVHLSDGSTALEQILVDEPEARFRYQVFAYTSSAARYVEYGVGEFVISANPEGGTHVEWTYQFRPRTLLGRMFLGGFVRRTWSPWMEGYLANLKAGAEASPTE